MRARTLAFSLLVALSLGGCATQTGHNGAVIGGVTGAGAGAIFDGRDPLRGAIVGGVLGSIFGGVIGDSAEINARGGHGYHQQPDYRYDNRRYDDRRFDNRRYDPPRRYEQPRVYHERCGCWGFVDHHGRFYPVR